MYCSKCGKEIDNEADICIYCGVATKNLSKKEQPVIINNSASSSASSLQTRMPIYYSGILDFFMILITSGLWIIWMIFRPKYR
jgi:uncharacterized membrane protein YvbJ